MFDYVIDSSVVGMVRNLGPVFVFVHTLVSLSTCNFKSQKRIFFGPIKTRWKLKFFRVSLHVIMVCKYCCIVILYRCAISQRWLISYLNTCFLFYVKINTYMNEECMYKDMKYVFLKILMSWRIVFICKYFFSIKIIF